MDGDGGMSIDAREHVILMRRYIGGVDGHGTQTLRIGMDAATRDVVVEVTEDSTGDVSARKASHAERASYQKERQNPALVERPVAVTPPDDTLEERRVAAKAIDPLLPTPEAIYAYLRVKHPEDFA